MEVTETSLPGVLMIRPRKFGDSRGYFVETWRELNYNEAGLAESFVQDNMSFSQQGVLRGLHFQLPNPQGKLVYCPIGQVYDVAVDIRYGSPAFGQWVGVTLSSEAGNQLYIPPGFAHGFCVTSKEALFCYKCTDYYNPAGDTGIRWDDPELGIQWPIEEASISEKDSHTPFLKDVPADQLPQYKI